MAGKNNPKRHINNWLLVILSLLLFFGIAELGLRLLKLQVNRTQGYLRFNCFKWVPDSSVPIRQQDRRLLWRCNPENEFRGRVGSSEKPANTYRVICLGDSTTQGFMSPPVFTRPQEAYPYKLELLLSSHDPSTHFEVLNAGCAGYSSLQGLRYFKTELLKLDLDLLIVWLGLNDTDTAILYADKEQRCPGKWTAAIKNILDKSKFYQFYKQGLFYLFSRLNNVRGKIAGENKRRVSPEDYRDNLRQIAQLAAENRIAVLFIIPLNNHSSRDKDRIETGRNTYFRDYAAVFDELQKKGAAVLDLVPAFQGLENARGYFYDNCHSTPAGSQVIAEAVYRALRENGIAGPAAGQRKGAACQR